MQHEGFVLNIYFAHYEHYIVFEKFKKALSVEWKYVSGLLMMMTVITMMMMTMMKTLMVTMMTTLMMT